MTMNERIVCSFLSVVGAASLVALVNPASASTVGIDAPRHTTITYRDLDLRNPAGRAAFDRRIASAANLVCSQDDWSRSASELSCRRNVFEQANRVVRLDRQSVRG